MRFLNIRVNSEQTKVNQIVTAVIKDIENGLLARGNQLPSINACSRAQKVSRDTVDKAYQKLKSSGYVASVSGLGFFIKTNKPVKYRILFIAGKFGTGENLFYASLLKALGGNADIDVRYHQNHAETLRDTLADNAGKYHYYIVASQNFSLPEQKKLSSVLRSVALKEVVLLNNAGVKRSSYYVTIVHGGNNSLYNTLCRLKIPQSRYRNICLLNHTGAAQFAATVHALKKYSDVHTKKFTITGVSEKKLLHPSTLYIVHDDGDLVSLLKLIGNSTYKIGRDIDVISLSDDSVFKELLNVSVITTDFEGLGQSVAAMIEMNKLEQIPNALKITMRGSV
ncbi:MAG: winged helix-turn-helix domain-containing protein [Bacteroidota bacterium]